MSEKIDNPLISERFRSSPNYTAFLEAASDYVNLDWEKNIKADSIVAVNLAALGAFFAWEFGINADQSVRHISAVQSKTHPRDATSYRDILAFVITERATKNIKGEEYGISAHVHPALDAAEKAGADVRTLREFVAGKHRGNYIKLPPPIRRFAKESLSHGSYLGDIDSCLGVIGLSRELLLDQVFARISSSLPDESKFDEYKYFLDAHVTIDTGDHGPKMAKILEDCVQDVDRALEAATSFLMRRTSVYREVLSMREALLNSGIRRGM